MGSAFDDQCSNDDSFFQSVGAFVMSNLFEPNPGKSPFS